MWGAGWEKVRTGRQGMGTIWAPVMVHKVNLDLQTGINIVPAGCRQVPADICLLLVTSVATHVAHWPHATNLRSQS